MRAIDGISVDVLAGEFAALYGPSGSGKSTLLMLIAGVLRPDEGQVVVDGRDIFGLGRRELADYQRLELGFIEQLPNLLQGASAVENAALKLLDASIGWREARRRVTPLLIELGLERRLDYRAERLSMGERQRVVIARALATNPKLVLADEPTGSLDRKRSTEVLELLARLCRDRDVAMLLATHDPLAATMADTLYVLEDGQLVTHDPDAATPALGR